MADRERRRRSPINAKSKSRSRSRSPIQRVQIKAVDREKTCPLLLRVFWTDGRHHRPEEFFRTVPSNELQIYTWKDATLKELMTLIKEVNPDARKKGTTFDFATVFPNPRQPGFLLKELGTTTAGKKSPADTITLESKKFQIGDYIDVAVQYPRPIRH
ncbi:histone deacetylase complex subunit SAP18-like [Dendronephthya gigantea]|uniref:histone deacetylase complex subunit SAP18-like n=1 Tax=Dendronephthya gigantea TaxID=151771 RepID=UPI00106CF462|nr:histone deacetylase complex subunit SAP18-like [Dendronephthya gigantea]